MGHDHAVVVGASMGGLAAAAELSRHFSHVTVLERDKIIDELDFRRGVPQARHAHALLEVGQRAWNDWFPGFTDALISDGAVRIDMSAARFWLQGGYLAREDRPERPLCSMSRPLVEAVARRHVKARANVEFRVGVAARGVRVVGDRVTGVDLEHDGEQTAVESDLVVDCTGRASRTLRWIESLGFPMPPVSQVFVNVTYASRVLRRAPDDIDGSLAAIVDTPPGRRAAALFPLEHDRWICGVVGINGEAVPTDDVGFLDFAETLPTPDIAHVIRKQEALTPVAVHRFPSSQRRHFEKLGKLPLGLVALGDSMCSFNPIYGQGMAVAALQAQALGQTLNDHPSSTAEFGRVYYKRSAAALSVPWQFAAGGDFQWPGTTGARPRGIGVSNRYAARITRAGHRNGKVADRFFLVQQLLAPPAALMSPSMMWNAWRFGRKTDNGQSAFSLRPGGSP